MRNTHRHFCPLVDWMGRRYPLCRDPLAPFRQPVEYPICPRCIAILDWWVGMHGGGFRPHEEWAMERARILADAAPRLFQTLYRNLLEYVRPAEIGEQK